MSNTIIKDLLEFSRTLKVLYVEDNPEARAQTLKLLQNFFEEITTANDGAEGLELYKNSRYDLVISDIQMPVMTGYEMSREILKINSNQAILVISAYNDKEDLQNIMDIGISSYIHKPIDMQRLITVLNKVVSTVAEKSKAEYSIRHIEQLNKELDNLIKTFDEHVIASRTDPKGIITYASKAYQRISGYTEEELIGQPHNIIRHPDMPSSAFAELWATIKAGKLWTGEVKNLRKDGSHYWVKAFIAPYYDIDGNLVGYSSIREDITHRKQIEELNKKINDLLNNSDQGFLSFSYADGSFTVEEGLSKECCEIFGHNIEGENISEKLFGSSPDKKELFEKGVANFFAADDELSRELYMELLPKEHTLNGKILSINYKHLSHERIMLIISDISQKRELEKEIANQSKIQSMIVEVVANQNEFFRLKADFEEFMAKIETKFRDNNSKIEDIIYIIRELHTYKGLFAQKEMVHTTSSIHELESAINRIVKEDEDISETMSKLLKEMKLREHFDKDLQIIEKVLGISCVSTEPSVSIKMQSIKNIEEKIVSGLLSSSGINAEVILHDVLEEIQSLKALPVGELIRKYTHNIDKIAARLDKIIYPAEVICDDGLYVAEDYNHFLKSLIHVFRNCIDHGIEHQETRLLNQKDPRGTIICRCEKIGRMLEISITDDGAGIDIESLTRKALSKGVITEEILNDMTYHDKLMLVFSDGISTRDALSEISGRGIGLAAVKEEAEKLGGIISVENSSGKGVSFIFTIPYIIDNRNIRSIKENSTILSVITHKSKDFFMYDLEMGPVRQKELTDTGLYEYNIKIQYFGDIAKTIVFSFDEKLIGLLAPVFIPDGFEEDYEEMLHNLPEEIANTISGLSIQYFPVEYGNVQLSGPSTISSAETYELIKSDYTAIDVLAVGTGKIRCAVVSSYRR